MIAILGSGVSGLFAAWACFLSDKEFVILSNTLQKPNVFGFVYLHSKCRLPSVKYGYLHQRIHPAGISNSEDRGI